MYNNGFRIPFKSMGGLKTYNWLIFGDAINCKLKAQFLILNNEEHVDVSE